MQIKSLQVNSFRNYSAQSVEFCDYLNILEGANASGKTNLLEAVYLLSVGKSPRTNNEKELIKIGEEKAYIKAVINKKFRKHVIETLIDKQGKKIRIDGIPILRAHELIGLLDVVYFSPDEMKIVKDSPAERRRHMDIFLSQQSANYFRTLIKYNHILKQRNKLLKTEWSNPHLSEMLSIWDIQLAEENARLVLSRRKFLADLSPLSNSVQSNLTSGNEKLSLSYESNVIGDNLEELKETQLQAYKKDREKDISLQFTSSGAHRDDFKITINGNDARKIASQGQQRTAALSILIAELDLFKAETGETPVLLLDDVLSELDDKRKNELMNAVSRSQTILTCTEADVSPKSYYKKFKVSEGQVKFI